MIALAVNSDVSTIGKEIRQKIEAIDFNKVNRSIAEVIKNSIDRNFSEGGRWGNQNIYRGGGFEWIISKAARMRNGKTLSKTGRLRSSIISSVKVSYKNGAITINVGSNLKYAAIHQFGGRIDQAARSNVYRNNRYKRGSKKGKYKKGMSGETKGTTYGSKVIIMPARPYIVLQDEDINLIHRILKDFIKNELAR